MLFLPVTMIEFEDGHIVVNETDDYVVATIKRKGMYNLLLNTFFFFKTDEQYCFIDLICEWMQ